MGDKSTRYGGFDPFTGAAKAAARARNSRASVDSKGDSLLGSMAAQAEQRQKAGQAIVDATTPKPPSRPKAPPKPPKVEKSDPVTQTPEWQARQVKIDSAKMSNRITRRAKKYLGG